MPKGQDASFDFSTSRAPSMGRYSFLCSHVQASTTITPFPPGKSLFITNRNSKPFRVRIRWEIKCFPQLSVPVLLQLRGMEFAVLGSPAPSPTANQRRRSQNKYGQKPAVHLVLSCHAAVKRVINATCGHHLPLCKFTVST
ncbi:unnamed protein product [Bursaphelenchus okinawaensis]|uniref:Uncharacterized protein n=1 Tax=Bursaphelenchus okinawaensis TaxID=465554 RepID=A0A811KJ48_9BILA|nr:unnamed protein product [Bursaphelenchus okinawaensis]CAG9103936.1 unnamed protein product [Bursaphelenchus okinawaensis]